MVIGIVGSEAAKFTPETEAKAKDLIRKLLCDSKITRVSSGHCHLGGIDIWAEELADELGLPKLIFPPKFLSWEFYKERNMQIAHASDIVHCITLARLPDSYTGMRFEECYHCGTRSHVKSGGCWTVKYAKRIGKSGEVHVIQ